MRLVWKLLRRHISIFQLLGFFLANLVGMFVVMLGYQFYRDVIPVFTSADSFMKADYIVINKKIGMGSAVSGRSNTFSSTEIEDLSHQPFTSDVGVFSKADYKIDGAMGIDGTPILQSELFFESVPDQFVDVPLDGWKYVAGSNEVPIILPRSYIAMYNFGFAQGRSLPKLSDGLAGLIDFRLYLHGEKGHEEQLKGRVIGFSGRLNTILVPQSFMDWSNNRLSPDSEAAAPSRLIMRVDNPTDERVAHYLDEKGYEIESGNIDNEKTAYFLRVVATMVVAVGIIISLLSIYILMLSIYLLVEKNSVKLQTLLLIGYPVRKVALPYQWLAVGLNILILFLAWAGVCLLRNTYINVVEALFPEADGASATASMLLGMVICIVVSMLNISAIYNKVKSLSK